MTIYRAVPDVVEGARVESKNITLNGDLWRDRLIAWLNRGWTMDRGVAEFDAGMLRGYKEKPVDNIMRFM